MEFSMSFLVALALLGAVNIQASAVKPADELNEAKVKTSAALPQPVEPSVPHEKLINALRANAKFRRIAAFAKQAGSDGNDIKDVLTRALGLQVPGIQIRANQNLQNDLNDFIALIPAENITEIVFDYLANDPETQELATYLQSEAFQTLVEELEGMQVTRDLLADLEGFGLPAYDFINQINGLLGLPELEQPNRRVRSLSMVTGGIKGLIADIKATLPIDKIKALYQQKLLNSPAFSNLIGHLRTPQFRQLVDAFSANDKTREIINKLKEHNVDLRAIAKPVSTFLGLSFQKPTVTNVLAMN